MSATASRCGAGCREDGVSWITGSRLAGEMTIIVVTSLFQEDSMQTVAWCYVYRTEMA